MNRRVKESGKSRKMKRGPFLFRRPPNPPVAKDTSVMPDPGKTGIQAPPKRVSIGYVLLLILICVGVAGAFVFHLHVRFDGIRLGYETSNARALQTKLLLERRELRLELASLKSPGHVETEARERLGMSVPDHQRIIAIGKERKVVSVSGGAL